MLYQIQRIVVKSKLTERRFTSAETEKQKAAIRLVIELISSNDNSSDWHSKAALI
jgi:hypothetical protein